MNVALFLLLVSSCVAAKGVAIAPVDAATHTFRTHAGHEWEYNLWRIAGMAHALSDGMPGRWLADFGHGWGYPLFHYKPALPYLVGGLFHLLGLDAHTSLNLCWLGAIFIAGLTMFWALRPLFDDWGALLAGVCYLFAPYHLLDIYVRTNLPETVAFIFPPLILVAVAQSGTNTRVAATLGALAVMLLSLPHLLSTLTVGFGFLLFTTFYAALYSGDRRGVLQRAFVVGLSGLALGSFFWLPALTDATAVRGTAAMTADYYHYANHFLWPAQLIASAWAYGASDPGPHDGMSFSLGIPIAAAALISFAISVLVLLHRRAERCSERLRLPRIVVASFLSALACVFMTLEESAVLWKTVPGMALAQFPWRFLLPACFFLAACAGALPRFAALLVKRPSASAVVSVGVSLCIIYFHWSFAAAGGYGTLERAAITSEGMRGRGVWTTNQLEFFPNHARAIPSAGSVRHNIAFLPNVAGGDAGGIVEASLGNGNASVILRPGPPGILVVNQLWHPAWQAAFNGRIVDTFPYTSHPFGPVAVILPAGVTHVEFRYGMTPSLRVGILLSLLASLSGLVILSRSAEKAALAIARPAALLLLVGLAWYSGSAVPFSPSHAERIAAVSEIVTARDLAVAKENGEEWDSPGTAVINEDGVRITFDGLNHAPVLELSLDSNDVYLLTFMRDGAVVGADVFGKLPQNGLAVRFAEVGVQGLRGGYDELVIVPLAGDGMYSVGHVLLRSEGVRK